MPINVDTDTCSGYRDLACHLTHCNIEHSNNGIQVHMGINVELVKIVRE